MSLLLVQTQRTIKGSGFFGPIETGLPVDTRALGGGPGFGWGGPSSVPSWGESTSCGYGMFTVSGTVTGRSAVLTFTTPQILGSQESVVVAASVSWAPYTRSVASTVYDSAGGPVLQLDMPDGFVMHLQHASPQTVSVWDTASKADGSC